MYTEHNAHNYLLYKAEYNVALTSANACMPLISLALKDIKYAFIASHRSANTFLNTSDKQVKSWCLTQLIIIQLINVKMPTFLAF